MAPIPDYETISMEAFVITKIRTFKNEPLFFIVGAERGTLICGTLHCSTWVGAESLWVGLIVYGWGWTLVEHFEYIQN